MFGSRSRREGRFAALRAATRTPSPSSFALASFGGQVRERPARRSFSEGGPGVRATTAIVYPSVRGTMRAYAVAHNRAAHARRRLDHLPRGVPSLSGRATSGQGDPSLVRRGAGRLDDLSAFL